MTRLPPPWMIREIEKSRRAPEQHPQLDLPEPPPPSRREPVHEPRRVIVIEL